MNDKGFFHERDEGEYICYGFNFYPNGSVHFGYVLRLYMIRFDFVQYFRLNKSNKKLHITHSFVKRVAA